MPPSKPQPLTASTNNDESHVKQERTVEIEHLSKNSRKRSIDEDERMARDLHDALNSTQGRSRRHASTTQANPARMKRARVSDGSNNNRNNPFNRLLLLSPDLANLMGGESHMSRPQVVKKIWEHVREHDLQDPSDKRQIICDQAMRHVFKVENVNIFTMNKVNRLPNFASV